MNLIYWISTGLISSVILLSAVTYFFHQPTIVGLRELGFPDFFRVQLGVMKLIAVICLLIPAIPINVKEWAYAGVGCFLITAIVAHTAHKDSIFLTFLNVFFIILLAVSNFYLHKVHPL